jgi:hypothetical protein
MNRPGQAAGNKTDAKESPSIFHLLISTAWTPLRAAASCVRSSFVRAATQVFAEVAHAENLLYSRSRSIM